MQQSTESTPRKARYAYADHGFVIHASRCLTKGERRHLALDMMNFRIATGETKNEMGRRLAQHDIHKVPVKRRILIDRSRYTGERLREIRAAGGGKKERARAADRVFLAEMRAAGMRAGAVIAAAYAAKVA